MTVEPCAQCAGALVLVRMPRVVFGTWDDKAGKVTHYVADGKLDQIGYDQRTLKGTWTAGTTKGDFKLTRDRDYTR